MLCRYGGLTQRAVAERLGVRIGGAVCCQIRKLNRQLKSDAILRGRVGAVENRLQALLARAAVVNLISKG